MTRSDLKVAKRHRKARGVRHRLSTGSDRPRLSVFRSLTNIYCQVINDHVGQTIVAASSRDKQLRDNLQGVRKTDIAAKVGAILAERAKAAGVTKVKFDRGGYKFHGRIKALADAARAGGLDF